MASPVNPVPTDIDAAQRTLNEFSAQVKSLRQSSPAPADQGTNIVKVVPGDEVFPTIGAALDSIKDASAEKQYSVIIGPGTYNERVTLKPYTNLFGSGIDKTIVSAPADGQGNNGTINAASNSSIEALTVESIGHNFGDWVIALSLLSVAPFEAIGVKFVGKGAPNVNQRTILMQYSGTQENIANFGDCQIVSDGADNQPNNNAVILFVGYAFIDLCSISASGPGSSEGVSANWGGTINLNASKIQGVAWALNIDGPSSHMTAENCVIDGPVSEGVKVINNGE